jgi:hypothetical protein
VTSIGLPDLAKLLFELLQTCSQSMGRSNMGLSMIPPLLIGTHRLETCAVDCRYGEVSIDGVKINQHSGSIGLLAKA